jgi:hypothetical protein
LARRFLGPNLPYATGPKLDEPEGAEGLVKVGPSLQHGAHHGASSRQPSAARGHSLDESKLDPLASTPYGFELSGQLGHDVPFARLRRKPDGPSEISLSRIVVNGALRVPPLASFGFLSRRFTAI